MRTKRRVLVIAHAFPPCGGAGVQRVAKTVEHLWRSGWQPSVLTVDPSCYGMRDMSHAVAGVETIVRTRCFDPIAHVTRAPRATARADAPEQRQSWRHRLVRTVARAAWTIADRTLLVPDRFVLWYPVAVQTGIRMHRETPFDAVLATGEPYSAFVIAHALGRRTGVPFVLDMRDPWTLLSYRAERPSRVRAAVERWQEQRALEACAACIFANRAVDAYADHFPQWREKFHYIPNGYDPSDFAGVEPRRFERFTIVHNGTFLPGYRTAVTFLRAVRRLLDEHPELRTRLQVAFVGKIGEERSVAEHLGLQDVVRHVGYRPHRESLSYVAGADLLLLVGGAHQWEETGKIFEYLAAGRPILALVEPSGAAAELLTRAGRQSQVVPRESIDGAVAALRRAINQPRSLECRQPHWLSEYRRDRLAQRVARVLDSVVERRIAFTPSLRPVSNA
jgi:glycosyltransferase involved in cell wall biosynthesis